MDIFVPSLITEENENYLSAHVVRGQQCSYKPNGPEQWSYVFLFPRGKQDLVLGPKPCEWRHTRNCQPTDDERGGSYWHRDPERAHLPNVLFVVHPMNDRTRAQEQQRLEERMSDHMKDRSYVCSRTDRKEHVTQLADGRIGQHSFDVMLGDRTQSCEERRRSPYHRYDNQGVVGQNIVHSH